MYIETNEITTHLGVEQIEAISDGNSTMLEEAINSALVQVRGYLKGKYDIAAEFAKTGTARNSLLVTYVKDIAVWHFINICHVNTSIEERAKRRDDAVKDLMKAQKGDFDFELPALPVEQKADTITYSSNRRRNNHY